MPDFTVTLIHRAIVCGSITVEAENFDAARSAALSRADEASWPVDETGSVVRPSDQQAAVVADYARNDTTREEVYFDEALPPSTAPPAPSDAPAPAAPRRFWIVNTCVPGETVPSWPSLFATEAEANAFADEKMRDEWETYAPRDNDDDPLPYPGDWRKAQDAIVASDDDNLWGQWEITPHDLPDPPADPVKADMLAALKRLAEIIRDRHRLHGEDIGYALASLKDAEAVIARAEGRA